MVEVNKVLLQEVTKEGCEGVVSIYSINNSYLSIEYMGKEVYYTKDKEMAPGIANSILFFYRTLAEGFQFFKEGTEEEQWIAFRNFMTEKSKNNEIGITLCTAIYNSVEKTYFDSIDKKNLDPVIRKQRSVVQSKDNLMRAIHQINALNKDEALRNSKRYMKVRNEFVNKNPQLQLDEL